MHAYRDTLIGGTTEITRGISGGYVWTARVDSVSSTRLNVSVRRAGTNSNIDVERVPNYVMADIARVMTFGSETGRETNETVAVARWAVTMKHDNGTVRITVNAPDAESAKRYVCSAESAPLRSAINVERVQ